jgi:lysozyme family protein
MRENFPPALTFTLGFEGGFANHPDDPGGATMKGVTLSTFRRYKPDATVAELKAISNDMLQRIYRDGYWNEIEGDRLAAGVDGATFDYAVNSGPGAAKKSLLAVLGGPAAETVRKLCKRRLAIYQTFRHWKTFGKGWTRRVTAGEALWVKWALAGENDPAIVKQQLDDAAAKAKKTSDKQTTGAAGGAAGGTGTATAVDPAQADQLAGWILAGAATAVIALVVWLLWRAHLNRQRAKAYAAEAEGVAI